MSEKLKTCFVVCPIGEPGTPTRYHSDTVFECYVEPAIAAVGGFEAPVRADHIAKSGIITHHVFQQIAEADLVIADLTGPNANVFYELGVRHTLKKRFVQMITKGQNIPFDVKQLRTIDFEITDLRGAKKVVEDLTAAIQECFKEGFEVQTPLGYSATLEILDKGDAQAQSLGLILDKLDTIAALQRSVPTGMMAGPFAVTVPHQGAVGVQGAQGPHSYNIPPAVVPWSRLREQAVRHAQEFARDVLRRELDPNELEDVLTAVRRTHQAGGIPGPMELETAISATILSSVRLHTAPNTPKG